MKLIIFIIMLTMMTISCGGDYEDWGYCWYCNCYVGYDHIKCPICKMPNYQNYKHRRYYNY